MASVTDPSAPSVSPASQETKLLVSVVIPCLNEAASIERCVELARNVLDDNEIRGEVVVVDNGSMDGSAELATRAGARVVHEKRRGYGSAYLAGFAAAKPTTGPTSRSARWRCTIRSISRSTHGSSSSGAAILR